jgi:hypothetical protein
MEIFYCINHNVGNGIFFLQIQDQTKLAHSQWLTQKLLEGGGGDFFLFLALIFTEKKICPDENPSPRPRPSINLVTLQNRPKYFFLLNFTQRSTPYVDVHEIIIKVCSDINGCI